MSLPSTATYYNKDNTILYKHFINVGWFLTEDNWIECIQELPSIYGTDHVNVYHITFPYNLFRRHEDELRTLYRADLEEYRKTNVYIVKKEVDIKSEPSPRKEYVTMIPMIRNVMPSIIANDIVGVQPMSGDISNIFSLKSKYSKYYIIRYIQQQYYYKLKNVVVKWFIFIKSFFNYMFKI